MRRSRFLSVCGVVAALLTLAPPTLATAATMALACSSPGAILFAGSETNPEHYIWGVRSSITYLDPDLCGTDLGNSNGTSIAWSMVTATSLAYPNSPDFRGWAQSGFGQFGAGSYYGKHPPTAFSQYTKSCVTYGGCGGASKQVTAFLAMNFTIGTAYAFTSRFASTHSAIEMYANGYYIDETNFDPRQWWTQAWECEYYAETKEATSDVIGTASKKARMYPLEYMISDGSFVAPASIITKYDTDRYHANSFYASDGRLGVYTWTDPVN